MLIFTFTYSEITIMLQQKFFQNVLSILWLDLLISIVVLYHILSYTKYISRLKKKTLRIEIIVENELEILNNLQVQEPCVDWCFCKEEISMYLLFEGRIVANKSKNLLSLRANQVMVMNLCIVIIYHLLYKKMAAI